jgi:BA14K-like protein.
MKKIVASVAVTLAVLMIPFSASAQSHRPSDRGHQVERPSDGELVVRGIVSGLVEASRAKEPPRYERRMPPPPPRFEPPRRHGEFRGPPPRHVAPWSPAWHRWCSQTYRSFNPRTGTFIGKDGRAHFCEVR